jgi:hypothetical protein
MLREQRRIAYHGIIDRYHGSSNAWSEVSILGRDPSWSQSHSLAGTG